MKIAFICPWYGPDIPGGAEAEARRTVENLHQRGIPVEVWTTCVKDFEGDWGRNYYPAGDSQVNGVPVKRFPVGPRNGELFSSLNRRILSGEKLSRQEEDLFFQHMINSPLLYQHIRHQGPETFYFLSPIFSVPPIMGPGYFRTVLSLSPAFMMKVMPIWKSWVNCFTGCGG